MPTYDDTWALDWLIDQIRSEWERGEAPEREGAAPTESAPETEMRIAR